MGKKKHSTGGENVLQCPPCPGASRKRQRGTRTFQGQERAGKPIWPLLRAPGTGHRAPSWGQSPHTETRGNKRHVHWKPRHKAVSCTGDGVRHGARARVFLRRRTTTHFLLWGVEGKGFKQTLRRKAEDHKEAPGKMFGAASPGKRVTPTGAAYTRTRGPGCQEGKHRLRARSGNPWGGTHRAGRPPARPPGQGDRTSSHPGEESARPRGLPWTRGRPYSEHPQPETSQMCPHRRRDKPVKAQPRREPYLATGRHAREAVTARVGPRAERLPENTSCGMPTTAARAGRPHQGRTLGADRGP